MSKSRTKSGQKSLLDFLGGSGTKSKSKKTVTSSRKSSINIVETNEDLVDLISSSEDEGTSFDKTRKRRKLVSNKSVIVSKPSDESQLEISEPWVDKYTPLTLSNVAMHARKLNEIKSIVGQMLNGTSFTKILILTGPAGSSKSAVIKAIARDHGLEVSDISRQCSDSTDNRHSNSHTRDLVEWHNPDKSSGISLPEAFGDFLAGMTFSSKKAHGLILVEDIPNMTHYETKKLFNQALLEWINSSKKQLPPLIIIFTEVTITTTKELGRNYSYVQDDSLIAERIFSKRLLEDYRVKRIKVLPVNATLINKTLHSIVQHEPKVFATISKDKINGAIDSLKELGDIRSAIGGLEFWARWKIRGVDLSIPSARGSDLGLFHAIGRIIYGTKEKVKTKKKAVNRSDEENDEIAIQSVLDSWGSTNQQDSFNLVLYENYLCGKSCQMDIQSAAECSNILSLASLMNSYSADVSSELSCRGIRTNIRNAQIVPGSKPSSRPMTYSKDRQIAIRQSDVWLEYDRFIETTERTGHTISRTDAILYDGYYRPKINSSPYRIGGVISSFFGNSETIDIDDEPSQTTNTQITASIPQSMDAQLDSIQGLTFSDDDLESD